MLHYTLNTGHTRQSPREEVADDAIAACRPLLTVSDHHVLPGEFTAYRVGVRIRGSALLATIREVTGRPCVIIGVAPDIAAADIVWPTIEQEYLWISESVPGIREADFAAPHRPLITPWCAAMTFLATPSEAYWMADFERVLAWAWIEETAR